MRRTDARRREAAATRCTQREVREQTHAARTRVERSRWRPCPKKLLRSHEFGAQGETIQSKYGEPSNYTLGIHFAPQSTPVARTGTLDENVLPLVQDPGIYYLQTPTLYSVDNYNVQYINTSDPASAYVDQDSGDKSALDQYAQQINDLNAQISQAQANHQPTGALKAQLAQVEAQAAPVAAQYKVRLGALLDQTGASLPVIAGTGQNENISLSYLPGLQARGTGTHDTLSTSYSDHNILYGGAGNDYFGVLENAGAGATIYGSSGGNDIVNGLYKNLNNPDYFLDGDAGNDTYIGGGGNDLVYGGSGDDTVTILFITHHLPRGLQVEEVYSFGKPQPPPQAETAMSPSFPTERQ